MDRSQSIQLGRLHSLMPRFGVSRRGSTQFMEHKCPLVCDHELSAAPLPPLGITARAARFLIAQIGSQTWSRTPGP